MYHNIETPAFCQPAIALGRGDMAPLMSGGRRRSLSGPEPTP